ncbi:MAG: hypothetical protein ACLPTZ_08100 [Beijerinckiaceae bacterium]
MPRFAIAALVMLAASIAVTRPCESAEVENWTGDYLYTACENGLATEPQPLNAIKKLSDNSWCMGSLVMAAQALIVIHSCFEANFAKQIDSKTNPQEVARYIVSTATFGADVCFPENVNYHTLALVLLKYGREHPEQLSWASIKFAGIAFQSAYSCNRIK